MPEAGERLWRGGDDELGIVPAPERQAQIGERCGGLGPDAKFVGPRRFELRTAQALGLLRGKTIRDRVVFPD